MVLTRCRHFGSALQPHRYTNLLAHDGVGTVVLVFNGRKHQFSLTARIERQGTLIRSRVVACAHSELSVTLFDR